jgi:hypothetical protein
MRTLQMVTGLMVCASLLPAAPATADVVTDWNLIAADTIFAAGRPAPVPMLDFAVVHAAIHDAVQALDRRFEPYHVQIPGAAGSPHAAVAKAAYGVLRTRFPLQAAALTLKYDASIAALIAQGLAIPNDPGVLVGQQAAVAILNLRENDGSFPANPEIFTGGDDPGEWRPTPSFIGDPPVPPSFAPMSAPWMGRVDPFAVKHIGPFGAPPPPNLRSARYLRDFNEVKALGARFNSQRTADQTDLANFYADNFFGLWQRTLRSIAGADLTNIGDTARLFALANFASVDALIASWADKRHYNFWRPLTAIREGNRDGNRRTVGDASWEPYLNTPNYPDHTSGANALSAAMTRTLARFFGTNRMTFTITSASPLVLDPAKRTRTYRRFSDVRVDVVNVRIYQGIHFRSADRAGRRQGVRIADLTFHHLLRPLH